MFQLINPPWWRQKRLGKALCGVLLAYGLTMGVALAKPANKTVVRQWQSGSEDIFNVLTTRFAEQAGDYDQALSRLKDLTSRVKERALFAYAFALALEAEQLDKAQQFAALWQSAFPADDEPYYALLRVFVLRGQEQAALSLAEQMLQRQSSVEVVTQLSLILSTSPDAPMRLQFLQKLSERFPKNPYLFYYFGLAAKEEGRVSLALSAFEHAKALESSWIQLDIMQADTLSSVGRLREARAILEPLLKRQPEDPMLLSAMVDILADNYQFAQAIDFVKRWRSVQEEPQVLVLLAWLYAQEGDVEAAVALYRELQERGEIGEDDFWFNSAQAAEQAKQYDRAMQELAHIPAVSPLRMQALEKSALLWFKRGDVRQGQSAFAYLRSQFPEYALEHYLVEASQLRNDEEAMRQVLEQALQAYPEQVDLLAMRAEMLSQRDNLEAAEQLYQMILDRDPENLETLNAYGRLLISQPKRFAEGKALIEQAVQSYANTPTVQDAYAMLLVKEGKPEEALIWLRRAFAAYRRDYIAAHYIEILMMTGQESLACEVFQYERKGQTSALLESLEKRFPTLLTAGEGCLKPQNNT